MAVEHRRCPKSKAQKCVNCKPYCHITTGFSGAGAFSDGKLSLSCEVGGDLPSLIGEDVAQETIDYTDGIYLEFGADPHIEGLGNPEEVKRIRTRAIQAGLKLVDCPIRHLGTERAQQIYYAIEQYLLEHGVELRFGCECRDLILRDGACRGVLVAEGGVEREIFADHTVVATGRRGADWLERICAEHGIAHQPGTVDIGVRVECRNEIMERVNEVLYESKLIGYPKPFKNKVRTFCQNPGGFVSQENYDNNLAVVNGHSYKDVKSENTNLAILCSHNFSVPFNQPIAYAQKVGELTNMLGAGAHPRAALRRHPRRQAHMGQGAGAVKRPPDAARRRRRRHHRRHALPRDDEHPQLHAGNGPRRARLRLLRDAAVLAGTKVLLQPRQDGRRLQHLHPRAALPRRFQRLDARADDGERDGRADGRRIAAE